MNSLMNFVQGVRSDGTASARRTGERDNPGNPRWREKQYYCPKCQRGFTLKSNCNRHFKYECGFEPRYKCPYCELRSKQTSQIYSHIRKKHAGEKVCFVKVDDVEKID